MFPVRRAIPVSYHREVGALLHLRAKKLTWNGWHINPTKTTTVSMSWDFYVLGNLSLVFINCCTRVCADLNRLLIFFALLLRRPKLG